MKHYKLVERLSNLNVKPPCTNVKPFRTNVKPPYWRHPGDGFALIPKNIGLGTLVGVMALVKVVVVVVFASEG